MKNSHTPTPWSAYQSDSGSWVIENEKDRKNRAVCETINVGVFRRPPYVQKADAAHIVKCVNAHEELLAACKALLQDQWFEIGQLDEGERKQSPFPSFMKNMERAEKAIAKAEGIQ